MATKPTLDQIRKKVIGKQQTFQNFAFTINRDADVDLEARTVKLAFASNKPIDNWWYGKIELQMGKKNVRTARLESGAPLLMDHNTRDVVGVIRDYSFDSDGIARCTVEFGESVRAEEVFQDVRKGIRQNVSVGFMIWELNLKSDKKGETRVYTADDWEPYEVSIVAVPADISVGIGRDLGDDACETCGEDPCICEPADDEEEVLQASRQQRAISPNEENKMTKEEIAAAAAAEEAARNQRTPAQIAREEISEAATALGKPELAPAFHQKRLLDGIESEPTLNEFKAFARTQITPTVKVPVMDPATAARAALGVHSDGEAVVDRNTRQVLQGEHLTDNQMNAICSREYKEAFVTYLRQKGERNLSDGYKRALSEGSDSEGGFLVPGEFLAKMVEREPAATELQSLVTNLTTGSDKLTMPKNAYSASSLYTTGVRVSWVDEKTGPSSESDASDFGNITIPIHTAMMYHDVTNNMIEDSQFDILGWLANKFRETADVVTENMIINGSGIGQPEGILLNPNGTDQPATVVSGSAATVTADGLLDLTYALLGRYTANARFVFNRLSTEKAIAKLKDTANRYLFSTGIDMDGLAVKRPTELLGFPFVSSDFMPDLGANTYPIIFGDLKGYYLVRRVGFSVQVLNEIVATSNKVRVLGRMRIGGQVAEDWRLKIQKCST